MTLQLVLLLSLGLVSAIAAGDAYSSYYDSQNAYMTYGTYNTNSKIFTGGNSACPNEPIFYVNSWVLCCANEIKVFFQGTTIPPKCCGPDPYDPTSQFCCGGILHHIEVCIGKGIPGCCNGVVYDRLKFICCNNQLSKLESPGEISTLYECCGAVPSYTSTGYGYVTSYSGTAQAYNSGSAYSNDLTGSIYSSNNYPSYKSNYPTSYQNGYKDLIIDYFNQICCAGVSNNITGISSDQRQYLSCCGRKYYLNIAQACCGSVIVNRNPAMLQSCCGSGLYDISAELCCNNVKQNNTDSNGNELKCCGSNTYNPKSQKCCAGKIIDSYDGEYNYNIKCCGINTYDASTYMCCSGVPIKMIANVPIIYQKCCGFDVYDKTKWTCCNQETKVPKGKKCSYY